MSDLVKRLRDPKNIKIPRTLMDEAADEIDRLHKQLNDQNDRIEFLLMEVDQLEQQAKAAT